jgi:glycosyltransferase involved in cell wall biosynthesis
MKILIAVEWYFPIGGIESFVWKLVQNLGTEHEVTVAVKYVGQVVDLNVGESITVVDVSRSSFKKLDKLVKRLRPDVIHSNHISILGLACLRAGRKYRIPVLVTDHQTFNYEPKGVKLLLNPFVRLYFKVVNQLFDQVVVPSQTMNRLFTGLELSHVQTISCGVNIDLFRPGLKSAAREVLGMQNLPTLLFVGRIGKDKNLELIIQAAATLKKRNYSFQVMLVGPAPVRYATPEKPLSVARPAARRREHPMLSAARTATSALAPRPAVPAPSADGAWP